MINQVNGSATVSEDLGSSQQEEKLTLQAALGMRAKQSYLISDRNLVVEGADDYWVLTELSNVFQRSGEDGLPEDLMVTAAGSASEVVHLATFMIGQELQVVSLFDSDEAGRREEAKLRTKWLTRYKNARSATLLLGHAVNGDDRDFMLEDLFPDEYYLKRVLDSHAPKFRAVGADAAAVVLQGDGPILPRVETSFAAAGVHFNKGSAAKLIRKDLLRWDIKGLPLGTAEKARKLFAAIRRALEPKGN